MTAKPEIWSSKDTQKVKSMNLMVYDVVSKIMLEYPNPAGFDNMKAISRR
jgi:hypothetical protein